METRLPKIEGFKYVCDKCGGDHSTETHGENLGESLAKAKELGEYLKRLTGEDDATITLKGDTLVVSATFAFKHNSQQVRRSVYHSLFDNPEFKNISLDREEVHAELVQPINEIQKVTVWMGKDM